MTNKSIYRRIVTAVDEAHGAHAAILVLHELADIFEMFGNEVEGLFEEDPENDDVSKGYYFAEGWCRNWAKEIEATHG